MIFSDTRRLYALQLDERALKVRGIHSLLPGQQFGRLALKFGPDGALYPIEYGWGRIVRLDYIGGDHRARGGASAVAGR